MTCPRCESTPLVEKDRDGILVDACPRCRGIWLDRGELEKLIAAAGRDRDDRDLDDDDDRPGDGRGRKRGWFQSLGDLFD